MKRQKKKKIVFEKKKKVSSAGLVMAWVNLTRLHCTVIAISLIKLIFDLIISIETTGGVPNASTGVLSPFADNFLVVYLGLWVLSWCGQRLVISMLLCLPEEIVRKIK